MFSRQYISQNIPPLNQCTFAKTGYTHQNQYWYNCRTCFSDSTFGVCINCASLCHQSHDLGQMQFGNFFCDCGSNNLCKAMVKTRPLDTQQQYYDHILQTADKFSITPDVMHDYTSQKHTQRYDQRHDQRHDQRNDQRNINTGFVEYNNNALIKIFNNIPQNRIISPISIMYALSMIHIGAKGGTEQELNDLFSGKMTFNDLQYVHSLFNKGPIKMSNYFAISNRFTFKSNYLSMISNIANVSTEDFNNSSYVINKINKIIENGTNGLIKNVLDKISYDTVGILINIIYFKANWLNKFNRSFTKRSNFTNIHGIKSVEMMNQSVTIPYYADNNIQMIELPYIGSKYCMGILLPNNISFSNPALDVSNIYEYIDHLHERKVDVYIPKFTHKRKVDLKPILKNIGVRSIFTDHADLSNISSNIKISDIIHEAVVIVDEEGTEAAAVTVISISENCMPLNSNVIFRADHSFIYYIRHIPTNALIFVGDYHGI